MLMWAYGMVDIRFCRFNECYAIVESSRIHICRFCISTRRDNWTTGCVVQRPVSVDYYVAWTALLTINDAHLSGMPMVTLYQQQQQQQQQ